MRNFTGLEWALLVVATLQLFAGISVLVVNSILVAVENIWIWEYRQSESIFGRATEYNYTLLTCSLYILGLSLFCCGIFGLCAVLMWRQRAVFVILYIFTTLVSLGCIGVVLYVIFDVVEHQQDRLERFKVIWPTTTSNSFECSPSTI
jgi:type IV secretory pathway VirB3-like protein